MRKMRLFPLLMAAAIAMSAASGCSAGNGGGTAQETGTKAASLPSSEAGTEDAGGDGAGGMDKAGKADEPEGADKAGKADEPEDADKAGKADEPEDADKSGKADEPEGADKSGEEVYSKIPDPVAEDGSKILFVGNSHTYTNDLPGVFYQMAEAGGHKVDVYDLTEGSYSLKMYSNPEDGLGSVLTEALKGENWDFVILQENTNAAIALNAKRDMYPYARELDGMIQKAGGQTVFLMTWAPKDGAGAFSHEMVQTQLSLGYRTIAEELDALLIPGGEVFETARKQVESLELWGEDGQHPSEDGTYLAACSAYALLFQESPAGNSFVGDLSETVAGNLQEIADAVILGTKKS